MHVMLRLVCLFLTLGSVLGLELTLQLSDSWQSFKKTHKRSYEAGEEITRKEVFKKNVEKIFEHNLKSDIVQLSYKLAVNEFADLTKQEFHEKRSGFRPAAEFTRTNRTKTLSLLDKEIPGDLDWRDTGYVTSVKNQGVECGSCWSFATVGAVEAHYGLATGKKLDLSEQNLVDCAVKRGCDGANPAFAFGYISRKGIMRESCYPYEDKQGSCRYDKGCVAARIRDFDLTASEDENDLLRVVATRGPVVAGIYSENDDFQFYKSGIYNPDTCGVEMTHSVLVIGYGTEDSQPYWLIKNSWGTSWGMEGYFKLARNAGNKCMVATEASYPIV